ncbi:hypothetical protein CHU98_g5098 [Xylaria longipes]|nr:hypothetical protein CHU98_g5098 [Xylaria longipes]
MGKYKNFSSQTPGITTLDNAHATLPQPICLAASLSDILVVISGPPTYPRACIIAFQLTWKTPMEVPSPMDFVLPLGTAGQDITRSVRDDSFGGNAKGNSNNYAIRHLATTYVELHYMNQSSSEHPILLYFAIELESSPCCPGLHRMGQRSEDT